MPETQIQEKQAQAANALLEALNAQPWSPWSIQWRSSSLGVLGVESGLASIGRDDEIGLGLISSALVVFRGGDTTGIVNRNDVRLHLHTTLHLAPHLGGGKLGELSVDFTADFKAAQVNAVFRLDDDVMYDGLVACWNRPRPE